MDDRDSGHFLWLSHGHIESEYFRSSIQCKKIVYSMNDEDCVLFMKDLSEIMNSAYRVMSIEPFVTTAINPHLLFKFNEE